MKMTLIALVAALTIAGAGTAFAATLNVGSWHLWSSSQTLTKATCTVTGATDTFVNEATPAQTNGSSATLDTLPETGSRKWTFLQFDLSSCNVPTTGGADSATLSLYLAAAPKGPMTETLTRVTSSWTTALNWTTAQSVAVAGSATAASATGTTNGVILTFTVTADVDDFLKGAANYGWRLTESGTQQNATKDLAQFASSEAAANKPKLVINYEK